MSTLEFEKVAIREAIKPQTMGSARSGDWISLRNYSKVRITCHFAQGHASGSAITVDKATDVAGTNESTGITLNNWWKLEDTPTTTANYTKGTAAASITGSATGTGSSIYVIEIDADELVPAVSDGTAYDCIQVEFGSSNASNIGQATYELLGARYPQTAAAASITD